MTTLSDIVNKIGEYEAIGFTRDQALLIIQTEQLIIIGDRLTNILNKVGNSDNRTP